MIIIKKFWVTFSVNQTYMVEVEAEDINSAVDKAENKLIYEGDSNRYMIDEGEYEYKSIEEVNTNN